MTHLLSRDALDTTHLAAAARASAQADWQPLWVARYRIALATLDLCCMIMAATLGYELRFGLTAAAREAHMYLGVAALIIAGWWVAMQYAGAYDIRHLGIGTSEAKRVLRASVLTTGALAIFCYAAHISVARGFVVCTMPLGALLLLLERSAVRSFVRHRRERGEWTQKILIVGTAEAARDLLETTRRAPGAGLQVIGVCVESHRPGDEFAPGVPVLGGVREAARAAEFVDADVVAVAGAGLGPRSVRELGWQLAGTRRGLVIAPSLTEIAGPRVHVSPVEGLPLMWLDQPQLGRLPRLLKRAFDLLAGSLLFVLAIPIYLVTAVAIKMSSRGPVIFKQSRLGVNGAEFTILKFRSMYRDAEARRAQIIELNEQDGAGVMFKIRCDPRVTPVGRVIRALSIDELPQLVHVLSGKMSLVGPRPLATQDSNYEGESRRRLLVRPGITGLWQVSGRSDLSWDDAVRLDLYYVENWSIGLDLTIIAKTVFAVLTRRGAY